MAQFTFMLDLIFSVKPKFLLHTTKSFQESNKHTFCMRQENLADGDCEKLMLVCGHVSAWLE